MKYEKYILILATIAYFTIFVYYAWPLTKVYFFDELINKKVKNRFTMNKSVDGCCCKFDKIKKINE